MKASVKEILKEIGKLSRNEFLELWDELDSLKSFYFFEHDEEPEETTEELECSDNDELPDVTEQTVKIKVDINCTSCIYFNNSNFSFCGTSKCKKTI